MAEFPVLSSACLPPTGYIKTILLHGGAVIDEHEHFVKQSIRNHYNILTANGIFRLSVPIVHHAPKMPFKDVRICFSEPWQRQHIHAIKSAYGKAPYFEHYFDKLEKIFLSAPEFLAELNRQLLQWSFNCMKVQPEIRFTDNYSAHEMDLRAASAKHADYFNQKMEGISYTQVFGDRMPFISNLSIADLIFNCGNLSEKILSGR